MNELKKDLPLKDQILVLNEMHGHDLKDLYESLDDCDQKELIKLLDNEQLVELLAYLDPEDSAEIVITLDSNRQEIIVNQMESDDVVDVINELEEIDKETLLALIDDEDISKSLDYHEDSAAGHMTLDIITLSPNMDVKEATKKLIKEAPEVESIQTMFVVSDDEGFLGTINLKQLIKAKSPTTISELMTKSPFVLADDSIMQAAFEMDNYALYEIAVVDNDHKLLGMITLDDALEHYQEESIEDFRKLSLVNDELEASALKSATVRLPWLLMLLVLSIPIALLSKVFEDVLALVAILALFQPLILDASGDVATQSLAVSLRVLNKNPKLIKKNGIYEVITGAINGLIMGALAFVITLVMTTNMQLATHSPVLLASTISISLFLTVVFGQFIGYLIPIILNKAGADPAAASGPLITTLADLFSILFFFGLAKVILGV